MPKTRDRFYDIDGLRFVAALIVVLYHYTFRGNAADGLNPASFDALGDITRYGYLGVDLFFMISGFVILMSAGHGNWGKFLISRFVRIYPALWLAIILTGAFMYFYDTEPLVLNIKTWALNFLLVGSYVGVPYLDSVYWSLLVEIKFYFLIFVALIFGIIQHIMRLLVVWLVACLVITFAPFKIPYLGFFLFPEYAHYFIAGSVFFLMRRDGVDWAKISLLIGSYGLSIYFGYLYLLRLEAKFQTGFSIWYVGGFITLFYAVMLLIALNKTKMINLPWMLKMGALTYPLYLIHQNIGYIGFNTLDGHVSRYVSLILITGLMLLVSYWIAEFSEKQLNPYFKKKTESVFDYLKLPR